MARVSYLGLVPRGECPTLYAENLNIGNNGVRLLTNLQDAVAVYWRVKTWRLGVVADWQRASGDIFSLSYQKDGLSPFNYIYESWNTPVPNGGPFYLSSSYYYGNKPSDEVGLICYEGFPDGLPPVLDEWQPIQGETHIYYGGIRRGEVSPDTLLVKFRFSGGRLNYHSDGNFTPVLNGEASTARETMRLHPFTPVYSNGTYGQKGEFEVIFEDKYGQVVRNACPIYGENRFAGATMNITISLTATEYWPYT